MVLLARRDAKRMENAKKHELKKAAAMIDEKDALQYRIEDLPSWVLFPDVDRAEWLNKVMETINFWFSFSLTFNALDFETNMAQC